MNINAIFQKKDCEINTEPCVIEKTVELTEKEYDHFYHNLLEDYSFIAENSDCMYQDNNGVRHCMLVLGKGIPDGYGKQYAAVPCGRARQGRFAED